MSIASPARNIPEHRIASPQRDDVIASQRIASPEWIGLSSHIASDVCSIVFRRHNGIQSIYHSTLWGAPYGYKSGGAHSMYFRVQIWRASPGSASHRSAAMQAPCSIASHRMAATQRSIASQRRNATFHSIAAHRSAALWRNRHIAAQRLAVTCQSIASM